MQKHKQKSDDQIIFEIIDEIGEMLDGKLHIIDTTNRLENDQAYRVYHAEGYCFDVSKEISENEDGKEETIYSYSAEWPEFAFLSVQKAIELVQDHKNKIKS